MIATCDICGQSDNHNHDPSEYEITDRWQHDETRDGAGCSWCGAWAQVDSNLLCEECFYEDQKG